MKKRFHIKRKQARKIFMILGPILALVALGAFYLLNSSPAPEESNELATSTPSESIVDESPEPSRADGLYISPEAIVQGDPVLIVAEGVTDTSSIKSFTFNNRPLVFFEHEGKATALLGVDLRSVPGTFPVVLTLKDGTRYQKSIVVKPKVMPKAEFGIPDKLGGNTTEAEKELTTTLVQEANIISSIPNSPTKLWSGDFAPALKESVVTDTYGYTRITGGSTFAHKGTDYRAPIGTPVYAMNSGIVRFTSFLRNYGHTVVIDHGLGLHTIYMHLSEIDVQDGQLVEKGELLGKSGDTGYVLGPHLHVTVRIWDISVDPEKFLEILGTDN